MGDLLRNFPGSVRARTKHAEKACSDLWGQLTILETVLDNYPQPKKGSGRYIWYQSLPTAINYISGWESLGNQ